MTSQKLERESAAYTRVTIWQNGKSYHLRATLPLKDGSGKLKQQWIGIGCKATKAGLKVAKAKAAKLESDLLMERFSWADWGRPEDQAGKTVKSIVPQFLDWKSESVKLDSLRNDYISYTQLLPDDELLTPELLTSICRSATEANSRGRKYCVMAFKQLGEYAGLEVNWKGLKGNYSPQAFDADKLPNDDDVAVNWKNISSPLVKWTYGIMATYGIRPHELYFLDCSRLPDDGVLKVLDGKTGERVAYPCRAEWVDEFTLWDVHQPECGSDVSHKRLGERASKAFKRHSVPHIPYALRHAYAIRLARLGVPVAIAAKWMGHSVSVHTGTYHSALSEREYKEVWERVIRGPQ